MLFAATYFLYLHRDDPCWTFDQLLRPDRRAVGISVGIRNRAASGSINVLRSKHRRSFPGGRTPAILPVKSLRRVSGFQF